VPGTSVPFTGGPGCIIFVMRTDSVKSDPNAAGLLRLRWAILSGIMVGLLFLCCTTFAIMTMAPFGLLEAAGALIEIPERLFGRERGSENAIHLAAAFYGTCWTACHYLWLRFAADPPAIPWRRVAYRTLQFAVIGALGYFGFLAYQRLSM